MELEQFVHIGRSTSSNPTDHAMSTMSSLNRVIVETRKVRSRITRDACIYVFCIYLRTNSDLCHLHHKLIGFYNRDDKCLQRGTNWIFNKWSGLLFVFKGLKLISRILTCIFSYTVGVCSLFRHYSIFRVPLNVLVRNGGGGGIRLPQVGNR
jgi:hypothetical protein